MKRWLGIALAMISCSFIAPASFAADPNPVVVDKCTQFLKNNNKNGWIQNNCDAKQVCVTFDKTGKCSKQTPLPSPLPSSTCKQISEEGSGFIFSYDPKTNTTRIFDPTGKETSVKGQLTDAQKKKRVDDYNKANGIACNDNTDPILPVGGLAPKPIAVFAE